MTQSARVKRNYSCCFASLQLFKQNISYRDAGCWHRSDREGHGALHHGSHFVYSGAGSTRGSTLHTCSTPSGYEWWCSSLDTDGGQNLEALLIWFSSRNRTEVYMQVTHRCVFTVVRMKQVKSSPGKSSKTGRCSGQASHRSSQHNSNELEFLFFTPLLPIEPLVI